MIQTMAEYQSIIANNDDSLTITNRANNTSTDNNQNNSEKYKLVLMGIKKY